MAFGDHGAISDAGGRMVSGRGRLGQSGMGSYNGAGGDKSWEYWRYWGFR